MAKEITVLVGNGRGRYEVLLYFPIPAGIRKQIGGADVVVSPSLELPTYGAQALSASQITSLDNGSAMFELQGFSKGPGMSEVDLLGVIRTAYAARASALGAIYQDRFEFIGRQFNK